jgi:hypothetical protein
MTSKYGQWLQSFFQRELTHGKHLAPNVSVKEKTSGDFFQIAAAMSFRHCLTRQMLRGQGDKIRSLKHVAKARRGIVNQKGFFEVIARPFAWMYDYKGRCLPDGVGHSLPSTLTWLSTLPLANAETNILIRLTTLKEANESQYGRRSICIPSPRKVHGQSKRHPTNTPKPPTSSFPFRPISVRSTAGW